VHFFPISPTNKEVPTNAAPLNTLVNVLKKSTDPLDPKEVRHSHRKALQLIGVNGN